MTTNTDKSGRVLAEDGSIINIADLIGGTETCRVCDINQYAPGSGRMIKEDGSVVNVAEGLLTLIDTIRHLDVMDIKVVDALPTSDIKSRVIYFVPTQDPEEDDYYNEYIRINDAWERVGSTKVDMSLYPTKTELESATQDLDYKITELNSNLDGLGYGENGVKNLFEDEIKWMENITVTRGTKSVSDGKITLTATSDDCYTDHDGSSWKNNGIKTIPCKPNTTYTLSWECEGDSEGNIYIFENGSTNNMRDTINKAHKLSITTSADAEYLTVRVGVRNSGTSITYWNFQLEEGDTATPYEPYIPSVKMLAEEVNQQKNDLGSYIPKQYYGKSITIESSGMYLVTATAMGYGVMACTYIVYTDYNIIRHIEKVSSINLTLSESGNVITPSYTENDIYFYVQRIANFWS